MNVKWILIAAVIACANPVQGATQQHSHPVRGTGQVEDGVRLSRVKLATGIEIDVAEAGPPEGEPVLLLHGYGDSWHSFSLILDRLPPGMRAIAPTQRGHGDSERPHCCYRMDDFATDAVALLDAFGIGRAAVVGHSMGSFIAQRMAVDHPERVSRLVLVGSGATVRTPAVLEFAEFVRTLEDPVSPEFVREFQSGVVTVPPPAGFFTTILSETGKLPARVWRDAMAGMIDSDAPQDLGRIGAPTLVVWGDHDALFQRHDQDVLVDAIPDARLVVFEGAGHCPNWEMPDRFAVELAAFLGAGGRKAPPREGRHTDHEHRETGTGRPRLLEGLGSWHHAITTTSAEAQRYFDQGLRLTYAFDHDEAVRSFEEAGRLDPTCAMCRWGIAYALGPNINLPMEGAAEVRAHEAILEARRLVEAGGTPRERDYVEALAHRYGVPAGAERAGRDSAWAAAAGELARRYPADADAGVLFADALLNLRPWNQWTRDGRAQPGTLDVVAELERVLGREPEHPGACHFFVHAVEASPQPERALPCAERLPGLMPGAGHVVHMPAHVYLRMGRYEDAARANIAAVETDRRYLGGRGESTGIYPSFYAPHNLHFLWATYLLSGQRAKALDTARSLVEAVSPEEAADVPSLQAFLTAPIFALVRFGAWEAVLSEPEPDAELIFARAAWHYARGIAHARSGRPAAAGAELRRVRELATAAPADMIVILNAAPALIELAATVLEGVAASEAGRHAEAVDHLRHAVVLEDGLTYDEPPPWYHSTRNLLGEALLRAGRAREAEAAFAADLVTLPENGWSLRGLERALRAQDKTREANDVAARLERAWRHADVSPGAGAA